MIKSLLLFAQLARVLASCFGILCDQTHDLTRNDAKIIPSLWPVYNDLRLPDWVIPLHYDLNITTRLDLYTFNGSVQISLEVTRPTKFIVFHAVGLLDLQVFIQGKEYLPMVNKKREYVVVYLEKELEIGLASLYIRFKGLLSDSLRGYYRAKVHSGNSSYYIATSQFEPTDARRAFPCFDEPGLKATFNITMFVQDGYHALSNMPIRLKEIENGYIKTSFYQTKKMSTYLIAFIVSDFKGIHGTTSRGIFYFLEKLGTNVSVWTQPTKLHQGEYGLQVAISVLEYYEKKFGIDYPLEKV